MKAVRPAGSTAQTLAGVAAQLNAALRRAAVAEERAAEAEYLAELIFELDLTGDSSIISQQVAGRLRQLSHADLLTISYGTRLRGVQVVILSGDAPPPAQGAAPAAGSK